MTMLKLDTASSSDDDMNSSEDELNVSRLITEEDLIDSLFYTCDVGKTGEVPVSRLIEYLKFTTCGTVENESELDYLATLLDPNNEDVAVDLSKYRKGIVKWIDDIRNRNDKKSGIEDMFFPDVSVGNSRMTDQKFSFSKEMAQISFGSFETSSSEVDSRREQEPIELLQRIADLQHQNKRLSEENAKLQHQLDTHEESLSTMSLETDNLRKKIRSLQEMVDLRQETQHENEELKVTVSKLQEKRKELENKINQLERENSWIENQKAQTEIKLHKLATDLDIAHSHHQEVHLALAEQKANLVQFEKDKSLQEMHLSERTFRLEELENCVKDLSKLNQELKVENNEILLLLSQSQQDLNSLQAKAKSFGDDSDEDEESDHSPSPKPFMVNHSTPIRRQSICMELKQMLEFDKHLPSPLCEKELEEEILSESQQNSEEDTTTGLDNLELTADLGLEFVGPVTKDDLSIEVSKFADKYKQKQEEILQQIESFINAGTTDSKDKNSPSKFLQQSLKVEMDKLAQKVSTLAKAKELADTRICTLTRGLKIVKAENSKLKQVQDNTRQLLHSSEKDLENCVDNRLVLLRDQLSEDRQQKAALEQQLTNKEEELTTVLLDAVKTRNLLEEASDTKRLLEAEIQKLKRSNLDLAEKCHKAELKVTELQEEITQTSEALCNEEKNREAVEESLASTKLAHQLDLNGIWRLVQKDMKNDWQDEQKSSPLSGSTEHLKDQIVEEIGSLKSQLYKRHAALGALVSRPKLKQLPLNSHQCGCHGDSQKRSPSSPLVEALTIDFLSSNEETSRSAGKATSCQSGVDSLLLEACPMHTNLHNCRNDSICHRNSARSCPSLNQKHQALVTSGTQTEEAGHSSQTNLQTSNSSSTSGVLDLDSSSSLRSLDGRNKRTNFIRSSLRCECDSQTSQSIESNTTDTDTSLPRQRSPSFRAAVEGASKSKCLQVDNSNEEDVAPVNPRRKLSYLTAIENQSPCDDCSEQFQRGRSSSFQAAIENSQETPTEPVAESDFISTSSDTTPENPNLPDTYWQAIGSQSHPNFSSPALISTSQSNCSSNTYSHPVRSDVKSVYFQLDHGVDTCHTLSSDVDMTYGSIEQQHIVDQPQCLPVYIYDNCSRTCTGNNMQPDNQAQTISPADSLVDKRISPHPARKLSTLIEEEDNGEVVDSERFVTSKGTPQELTHEDQGQSTSPEAVTSINYEHTMSGRASPQTVPATGGSPFRILSEGNIPVKQVARTSENRNLYPSLKMSPSSSAFYSTSPQDIVQLPAPDCSATRTAPSRESRAKSQLFSKSFSTHMEEESTSEEVLKEYPVCLQTHSTVVTDSWQQTNTRNPENGNRESYMDNTIGHSQRYSQTIQDTAVSGSVGLMGAADVIRRNSNHHQKELVEPSWEELSKVTSSISKLREEHLTRRREQRARKMPELSVLAEVDASSVSTVPPDSGSTSDQSAVLPSIPDIFLQRLGLIVDMAHSSTDELSDQEIENKFTSLSLAFKTDKQTLEKRLEIQERSRDISEQNVDKELQGLRHALDTLSHLCPDTKVHEVVTKIQHHIDVLEQSTARVSSRAEVFGAVQQEKRMSRAIEVMVQHVENLKRVHEREHSELEEARRLLQDTRPYGSSFDQGDSLNKRSASVCPNMGSRDPRQRFQLAVATTSMKNAVSNTFRRASLEKQSSSASLSPPAISREGSEDSSKTKDSPDKKLLTKQESKEEEAYQKGFEQGFRAQLGRELSDLREQQNSINQNLEEVMDQYDNPEEEDLTLKEQLVQKLWSFVPEWELSGKKVRMTMAGFVFVMAVLSVILSLFPVGSASLEVHAEYRHMGRPPH